ncbi:beta-galactosidase [Agromyces mangrovi Wang et al. 2018]|uniref:beta-galactosidase n=1 Tax=Agromyces mangrovi TaxID=1858653 RepID=UPI002572CC51|nr:beta-galactosidase [Agromyces mangrovi]BDZ64751.1 hypothetical protein GCM10025877_16890 [Agromyces mangrovi]
MTQHHRDLNLRVADERTAPTRPRLANDEDARPGLELTSAGILRAGRPWIPVSGELHYSRVPRDRWEERLRLMVAGGISVVSSYVPWLHHAPDGPEASFAGNLDLAAFVDLARAQGLEVVLRIGPWVHAEMRNGGFPDWVQEASVAHRTDDPAYLALVLEWWRQLGDHLDGRCTPATVLGIQLENELYDQPGHLVTLKRLARECGMSAPFWTATAWGGAELPPGEVFPLYGGYADGFWVDADAPWDPTFREHFFHSDVWDDPGIGADVRDGEAKPERSTFDTAFPPATCELGGGMATAYHRRPLPSGRDVAAVAHCKIGNGSAWQGFFMYVGGTNPRRGLQESQATGYPNDLPQLGYDFHAPVGEAGRLGDGHAELRVQHAFLAAFADVLGQSHLPDVRPDGVEDGETLRWAYRGGRDGGFVFVVWHQPHVPLPTYRGASFALDLGPRGVVRFPATPLDIPAGTLARWPVRLPVGGVRIEWLTASALTVLGGGASGGAPAGAVPTLVAIAERGVPVELGLGADATLASGVRATAGVAPSGAAAPATTAFEIEPSRDPIRITAPDGALDLLVLPAGDARRVWVQRDAEGGATRMLLADDALTWSVDGRIEARPEHPGAPAERPEVLAYDSATRSFAPLPMQYVARGAFAGTVGVTPLHPPRPGRPHGYGSRDGRAAAPGDDVMAAHAAEFRIELPPEASDPDACLEITWAGDVGEVLVDGVVVADRFWDASDWRVNCADAGLVPGSDVTLRILPLAPDVAVHVPAPAQAHRDATDGDLVALDGVRLTVRGLWREVR